ncbi:hypothetical protein BFU36_00465 [Sulfolobus sp. A20]|uniref:hypothetical protein n=1 Tax=Sulfolobaceae TaxID=118883 RepID=UPI000845F93D|nr:MULTISPECIES: hypothetical protein [unclassified Sulfolobus]TRM78363.1 hypothetical protein DJ528_04935 [Sulfolobus sp. B5]TRM88391.1 hypothetical protein DJ529_05455 [Sulfolobus sp. C3]TRM99700.1 hypothetical protein DJ527_08285 [Sulfolobus sp. F1]TRN02417.1 hypothetical protein DJ530_04495 [Sulfolobus sp. E1]AOL15458.1 hypothetical protein BFU36_00465 [Sulfolobus sp. A20]
MPNVFITINDDNSNEVYLTLIDAERFSKKGYKVYILFLNNSFLSNNQFKQIISELINNGVKIYTTQRVNDDSIEEIKFDDFMKMIDNNVDIFIRQGPACPNAVR